MKQLIYLILLIGITSTSQISVGFYADSKLLFIGDGKGNDAGTLNVVVIPKLNTPKGVFVYPLFEIANLYGGTYIRYALGGGYAFKLNRLSIEPSVDYGRILRWGGAYSSFNGLIELNYSITPQVGVSALASLTQRNDLKYRWEDATLRQNFYIGLTYNLN